MNQFLPNVGKVETVVSLWQEEGKDYIDVDILKARFGTRAPKRLKRTPNLTFEEISQEVIIKDEQVGNVGVIELFGGVKVGDEIGGESNSD